MKFKVNSMYQTATGYLIPRSHLNAGGKGAKYCIVEVLQTDGKHYVKNTTTMTTQEIRRALELSKNE